MLPGLCVSSSLLHISSVFTVFSAYVDYCLALVCLHLYGHPMRNKNNICWKSPLRIGMELNVFLTITTKTKPCWNRKQSCDDLSQWLLSKCFSLALKRKVGKIGHSVKVQNSNRLFYWNAMFCYLKVIIIQPTLGGPKGGPPSGRQAAGEYLIWARRGYGDQIGRKKTLWCPL